MIVDLVCMYMKSSLIRVGGYDKSLVSKGIDLCDNKRKIDSVIKPRTKAHREVLMSQAIDY